MTPEHPRPRPVPGADPVVAQRIPHRERPGDGGATPPQGRGNVAGAPGVYRPMRTTTMTPGVAVPIGPAAPRPGPAPGSAHARPDAVPPDRDVAPAGLAAVADPHDEFGDFYRRSWDGVARALSLALGDTDLAVEATDEAMARAYARWDKIRGYDNPAGWVYRVGLNWSRSYHRRLARRLPFRQPDTVEPPSVADPAIRQALAALPFGQRSVVVCRLLLDWSVAETATALDLRPATVRTRLHRALRTLESSLDHLRSPR